MIFADFGVAFVISLGLVIFVTVVARTIYKRNHPPLTSEEKTAKLERDLTEVNEQIKKIRTTGEWDI